MQRAAGKKNGVRARAARLLFFLRRRVLPRVVHSFPTRRSSDLAEVGRDPVVGRDGVGRVGARGRRVAAVLVLGQILGVARNRVTAAVSGRVEVEAIGGADV